ncbi:hypothetical protein COX95_04850 [bacterium CG_4_10_14_0_2_um_filter_33_32]|nr:MAG: hypothetical protein COX95_04850 [bacterium CG_4_10_14_0_2_um_filter_33_32]
MCSRSASLSSSSISFFRFILSSIFNFGTTAIFVNLTYLILYKIQLFIKSNSKKSSYLKKFK